MTQEEIWKDYPLNYEYEGVFRLQVSNFGNTRTFTKFHPQGKIVKGSLQGGYPILRIKLFKKRSAADQKRIQTLQEKIDELNDLIKTSRKKDHQLSNIAELREERDLLIQKRKKLNQQIDKKRCIHVAVLKHKAVAELFLDPPADQHKEFLIHKDFDKENNHMDNLAWASQEELNARAKKHPKNVLYAFKKQFMDLKPTAGNAKLSEADVLAIKKRLKKGDTLRKLAKRFHVTDMQIYRIKTGENWGHVKLLEDLIEEKKK